MSEQQLKQAFVEVLDLEPDVDWSALAYRSIPTWDSLGHMQLVARIEETFDIMLETSDVIDMSSYDVAVTILTRYGVSFDQ